MGQIKILINFQNEAFSFFNGKRYKVEFVNLMLFRRPPLYVMNPILTGLSMTFDIHMNLQNSGEVKDQSLK